MGNQIVARNNPVIASVVRGSMNDQDFFVVQELLPEVQVQKLTGDVKTFGRDHLRLINTVVKDGNTIMISHSVTKAQTWNIQNHELTSWISEEDADQFDDVDELKADFAEMDSETLMLCREAGVADTLTTSGNYASNTTLTLTGGQRYDDYVNSSPRMDIISMNEGVRVNCMHYPNRVVVNAAVLQYLQGHPQLRDAAMHIGEQVISVEKLKTIFFPTYSSDKCEILIGMAQYNSAQKGQTYSMTDLWPKCIIFAYVNPNPNPRQHQDSLGYSFGRGKQSRVQVIEWHDADWRDNEWKVKVRWEYDDVIFLDPSSKIVAGAAIFTAIS